MLILPKKNSNHPAYSRGLSDEQINSILSDVLIEFSNKEDFNFESVESVFNSLSLFNFSGSLPFQGNDNIQFQYDVLPKLFSFESSFDSKESFLQALGIALKNRHQIGISHLDEPQFNEKVLSSLKKAFVNQDLDFDHFFSNVGPWKRGDSVFDDLNNIAYFQSSGDMRKAKNLLLNSKMSPRGSGLEALYVDESRLFELGELILTLLHDRITFFVDEACYRNLIHHFEESNLKTIDLFDPSRSDSGLMIKAIKDSDEVFELINGANQFLLIAEDEDFQKKLADQALIENIFINISTAFYSDLRLQFNVFRNQLIENIFDSSEDNIRSIFSFKRILKGQGEIVR